MCLQTVVAVSYREGNCDNGFKGILLRLKRMCVLCLFFHLFSPLSQGLFSVLLTVLVPIFFVLPFPYLPALLALSS